MKPTSIALLSSSLLGLVAAVPIVAKRDIVMFTVTDLVIETVYETVTVWDEEVPSAPSTTPHSSLQSTVVPVLLTSTYAPVPSTTRQPLASSSSAALQYTFSPAPAPSPVAPTSTSVAPPPVKPTSIYTPPPSVAPTSTSVPPPPPPVKPTSTYIPPPPVAPTTTYVPPPPAKPTSTYVPPPPTSSAPSPSPAPVVPPSAPAAPPTPVNTPAPAPTSYGSYSGDITFYSPSAGYGACGWQNADTEPVIALAAGIMGYQSNGNPLCGKMIKITNPKTNKSAMGRVVDKCPSCTGGSLDLSPALFDLLGEQSAGRYHDVEWSWAS